jgi:hypothetical protein
MDEFQWHCDAEGTRCHLWWLDAAMPNGQSSTQPHHPGENRFEIGISKQQSWWQS